MPKFLTYKFKRSDVEQVERGKVGWNGCYCRVAGGPSSAPRTSLLAPGNSSCLTNGPLPGDCPPSQKTVFPELTPHPLPQDVAHGQ